MFNSPIENSLWVEKYRPKQLSEYIGNDVLKSTIQRYLDADDVPHLLFHARAGTGKTTIGKIIIDSISCDYLYINASDENNVDTIRTKIKSFVSSVGFQKWKIVLLDEADYLTSNAQAVLRNMMEKFSKNSRFILTCNYPEKIIDPIQSRCTVFEVYPPSKQEVAKRIIEILDLEKVKYNLKDVGVIVNGNYPDIRRVVSAAQRQVNVDNVLELNTQSKLEVDYLNKILAVLKSKDTPKKKYTAIRQVIADSKVRSFEDLYRFLYDNLEEFAPAGAQAGVIIEIAKAMREDVHCVDKEISIMAMLIEILNITT